MSPMPLMHAYQKAETIAATTQEPAIVISLHPRACVAFDALTAEDYRNDPAAGAFFDVVTPEEE